MLLVRSLVFSSLVLNAHVSTGCGTAARRFRRPDVERSPRSVATVDSWEINDKSLGNWDRMMTPVVESMSEDVAHGGRTVELNSMIMLMESKSAQARELLTQVVSV